MKPQKTPQNQGSEPKDRRQLVRETSHMVVAPRAPVTPAEHHDQPRKHGSHRGPRPVARSK